MKKINYIFLTMFFIICLCTGCGSKKEDVEVKNIEENEEVVEKDISKKLTFICDNNKIKVETPNSWSEYKEEKMNDDACLELIGADEIKYLIVISEEKSSFSSFNNWFDTVYSNVKESYQLDDSKIRRSDEGGLNTRFIENELEMNGEKVYLQLYFIETNNYYNQLLMWTELDNKTLYNSEFRDIAYSLKEIK